MGILDAMFYPGVKEALKQLGGEVGGEFADGGLFASNKVRVRARSWTITLDTFAVFRGRGGSTKYVRMRAPYVSLDDFRFTIYRKGIYSGLGKIFGMQDVEVGDPELDRDFVIKSNDPSKARALVASPGVRQLIQHQPSSYLEGKGGGSQPGEKLSQGIPGGVGGLHFREVGLVKDGEWFRALSELFVEALDQLCRIGSASEDDPKASP